MKALSVKNPWAMLIAHGIKSIENRSRRTKYRGTFLIHTSQKPAFTELQSCLTYPQWNEIPEAKQAEFLSGIWPNGCIIGQVDLVDCVINHSSVWAEQMAYHVCPVTGLHILRKGQPYVWNWVLENPVLYDKPIENVKGALSFWEYRKP
ncbi:ASCH domain-containing protein [Pedobacter metabolipauper]|uniref:ASCH domain-containing protein n=1 Tax=Pedobacter metabolipauper TaxID=425513 RepID=A0A4R6T0D7_9SPHI|nr:ASCH domain-containing protein [Pedobacter metabolipauper]TDQ12196.1 ASCH domain-containing protein [Pedobacter metabolipauper]